ncbi:MAG: T9SS type A sorting domain-containing protein [Candidatus Marinimicrobia bacterium]|nr:T9SS type A sorting domain-containing protein [Candidatus Neomarinimicrobiota bacterium]MCF7827623.1 T9SS type A sorting domain-containing protein [Candidatus Neomarinimicrobiota bacterium]MCF7881322.1 T9SS type A sorting domain-containing protein [Candidatus Neomarinimicrobiota bacterium]
MKKLLIPLVLIAFGMMTGVANAQVFEDYISSFSGDTAIVKTMTEMQGETDAIINAIELDENPPEGRVYGLKRGGFYFITRQLVSPSDRPITLAGMDDTPMATGEDDAGPPIFCGTTSGGTAQNGDMIQYNNDVTLKNAIYMPAATDGSQGWTFLVSGSAGNTVTLENVLMEHTNWVFMQSNSHAGSKLYIDDSYFVNMSGVATRRNGGVYDNVSNNTHTVNVENSTHVMAAGMMYKFRGFPINQAFFNHNTFVNCSGQLFTTMGYQSNWTVTNNLFVNSNVQAYHPGLDYGETDQDYLPMGIINVDTLRTVNDAGNEVLAIDSAWVQNNFEGDVADFGPDDRHVLVHLNGVYWDARLDQIADDLNASQDTTTFHSQMITMNSRTQALFDDDATYPYLTEGTWVMEGDPQFTETNELMGTMVDSLIKWSIESATPEDQATYIMTKWRSDGNPANSDNYHTPDWPVNADLSYSNAAYLSGGLNGYPLGDLNWFPDEKANWVADSAAEHQTLAAALENGEIVAVEGEQPATPVEFTLKQNYPNPFNPTTEIQFVLPKKSDVVLEVYDLLGNKVKTLVNKTLAANQYSYTWNATNELGKKVGAGMYIYRLKVGDQIQSKKMTLIK